MNGCYAQCLDGCRGRLSREHYVAESVLRLTGDTHQLSNAAWMKDGDDSREFSPADMSARILCEGHNSALAPLDRVGVDFCRFLLGALFDEEPSGATRKLHLDGMDLERWVLKAVTGAFVGGCVRMPDRIAWVPPRSWVEHLFGRRPCGGLGLCFVCASLEPKRGFEMVPLHQDKEVIGGNFWFNGLKLAILPDVAGPPRIGDGEAEPLDLIPRPDRIRFVKQGNECVLTLGWPDRGQERREVLYTATANPAMQPAGPAGRR